MPNHYNRWSTCRCVEVKPRKGRKLPYSGFRAEREGVASLECRITRPECRSGRLVVGVSIAVWTVALYKDEFKKQRSSSDAMSIVKRKSAY